MKLLYILVFVNEKNNPWRLEVPRLGGYPGCPQPMQRKRGEGIEGLWEDVTSREDNEHHLYIYVCERAHARAHRHTQTQTHTDIINQLQNTPPLTR